MLFSLTENEMKEVAKTSNGCKKSSRTVSAKRQYQSILSPITTSERLSPTAKYAMIERRIKVEIDGHVISCVKLPLLLDGINTVVSKVAVPITAAEPPSPSLLPSPPLGWVGATNKRKLVEKRRCVDVTQSLIMHLASSGILATA